MSFEEELIKLNEEELFRSPKSIQIEESDVLKNMGILANMVSEAIDELKNNDSILIEDSEKIYRIQMNCIKKLGTIKGTIEKYL